jgi:FkbM family methyltransferase
MTVTHAVRIGPIQFEVCNTDRYQRFWDRIDRGVWEPEIFAVFDRFLRPDRSCLDIGAWIGPTTLYAAGRARKVYALEPDPIARRELEQNVLLNPSLASRITVSGYCIAPVTGGVQLYAGGMYAEGGSALGDSMTSFVGSDGSVESILADGITLGDFERLHEIDDCDFIKMDIEGGEFAILTSHREYWRRVHPTLHVSFHVPPPKWREGCYRESFEVLESIYQCVYESSGRPIALSSLADGVSDWGDDTPGSPLANLDILTGAGIVASTTPW